MKLMVSLIAFLFSSSAVFAQLDEKQFTVSDVKLHKVSSKTSLLYPLDGLGSCDLQKPNQSIAEELSPIKIVVDEIINLGKKIWNIVEAGKPVVNVKTDVGTALPKGVSCWLDLQTWSQPAVETYEAVFTNAYGINVVKLQFQLVSVAGGSYNGQGSYIAYATMVPTVIEVSWGYKLDAKVMVPTVYNMGTKEQPVAGMNMQMSYTVDTVLKHGQYGHNFFLTGKGDVKQLN